MALYAVSPTSDAMLEGLKYERRNCKTMSPDTRKKFVSRSIGDMLRWTRQNMGFPKNMDVPDIIDHSFIVGGSVCSCGSRNMRNASTEVCTLWVQVLLCVSATNNSKIDNSILRPEAFSHFLSGQNLRLSGECVCRRVDSITSDDEHCLGPPQGGCLCYSTHSKRRAHE